MALLDDPDQLTDSALDDGSTNVFINIATKRIKLVPGQGGLIAADGVTEKAIYSFLKEEWRADPNTKGLAAIDFPMQPITDEFYNLIDGWDWEDATTEQSIRRGGWAVLNGSGATTKHFAAFAILNAESDDQIYYDLGAGAVNFTFPGNTAEAIQVIDDPNGDGNYADGYDRSGNITVYSREQGQLFNLNSSTAVGESSLLAPKLFSLALPTGADGNIVDNDITIAGSAPYTGMTITRYSTPQSRTIGASSRDFGWIIDGNNATKQQIYSFVQWALRQATDQDAGTGTLNGNLMPELLEFSGSTLKTKAAVNAEAGGTGVYIDNFNTTDTNDLVFVDNTSTERTFPFVAAGTLNFNANLVNDPDAVYRVYFTDGVTAGLEYGNGTAILVEDEGSVALSGNVGAQASIPFTFDYDGNNQGTRTPGTDVNVTAIASGLDGSQYVRTTATITRSNANSINFVANVERNFANPA